MKVLKFIFLVVGFIWTAFALSILFGGHELSKVNSVSACFLSAILFFMFSIATYSYGGDK